MVYLALRPEASASVEELHEHAQATIAERPAWPGADAAHRLVADLLTELSDPREASLPVTVSLGGTRGMQVTVTVPEERVAAEVQQLLSAHLFETVTLVGGVPAEAPS